MIVYLQSDFNYRICRKKYSDGDYIVVEKYAEDFFQTIYKKKTNDKTVNFKISADKNYYYFYCSGNNECIKEVCRASTHFLCVEMPDRCFTGAIIGAYTIGDTAEFLSFKADIK